jgi:hypothetical protein
MPRKFTRQSHWVSAIVPTCLFPRSGAPSRVGSIPIARSTFRCLALRAVLRRDLAKDGAHCFNLVKLAINDRTHIVPPSFEYDSSYWCESGLMLDHTALTRIALSFTVS